MNARLAILLVLACGCGDKTKLVMYADQSDPALRFALEEVIDLFRRENPGIEVKEEISDHEDYKTKLQGWLADGAPDVINWYGGQRMKFYVDQELLEDISDLWTSEAKDDMASTLGLVTVDNKQYGVPYTYYNWGIYYRKDLFEKAGVASPPRTWQEFLDACQKLKESGVTPIVIGTKDRWPAAGWFDYLDMRINGKDFHMALMAGNVPYTDPRVKEVFNHWRELISPGYYVKNHEKLAWQASQPLFYQGKGAMYLIGNFITPEFPPDVRGKMGFFQFPEITPGLAECEDAPTDTVHIPVKAQHKPEAKRFMKFLMRADVQGTLNARLKQLPTNKNAGVADDPFLQAGDEILRRAAASGRCTGPSGMPQFYDRDTTPPMALAGLEGFQEFMLHPDRVDAVLQRLEDKRQQLFAPGLERAWAAGQR